MSTSEIVSKLSTCTSTPTGIGGPEIQSKGTGGSHYWLLASFTKGGHKSNGRDHNLIVSYSVLIKKLCGVYNRLILPRATKSLQSNPTNIQ